MGVGIFFREEVIKNDLERFASQIGKHLEAKCSIIMDEGLEEIRMGYLVVTNQDVYKITMPYEKNDRCEYAILEEVWAVYSQKNKDGKSGFYTLGEVFDYIDKLEGKKIMDSEDENKILVEILAQTRLLLAQSENHEVLKLAKAIKLNAESCVASLGRSVSNLKGKSVQRYLELNEELKKENGQ